MNTESRLIPCRCWLWRHGLVGDHRDWRAEYERSRAAGRLVDEHWFAALAVAARLPIEAQP